MNGPELLAAAIDCFAKGDLEGAIAAARRAIEAEPVSPASPASPVIIDAYEMLGEFCSQAGRLDEAIAAAKKLLELDPSSAMGHANLSRYYMLMGDKTTAEEWLEKSRKLPPGVSKT